MQNAIGLAKELIRGVVTPSIAVTKHLTVKNDAFSTSVGEVTKYNSACVNTLRRSLDGY